MNGSSAATPPGWTYNPSTWEQRLPIAGAAMVGFAIATYLSLYQYGVLDSVWEPFFGNGSEKILDSKLSSVLPVKDAALGAASYLVDAIAGVVYGIDRWRTAPWIVVLFAIAVGPLGIISILLVIAQPVLYGSFCTLCLGSAAISLMMIPPAVDEALASSQELRRVKESGASVWTAFWRGSDTAYEKATARAGA
jgi:uncharacterized membrane protein